jgi:hypothetical protein
MPSSRFRDDRCVSGSGFARRQNRAIRRFTLNAYRILRIRYSWWDRNQVFSTQYLTRNERVERRLGHFRSFEERKGWPSARQSTVD